MEYCQKYDLDHVIYVKQNIFPSKFKNYKERKSHQERKNYKTWKQNYDLVYITTLSGLSFNKH